MFTVPASSSPPATPDYSSKKSQGLFSPSNNLSTTPAGPPPASLSQHSTTPAGPPPSSAFASARNGFGGPASFSPNASRSSPLRHVATAYGTRGDDDDAFDAMDEDRDMLSFRDSVQDDLPAAQDMSIRAVARGLAKPAAALHEPADLVLTTELVLQKLWNFQEEHAQDQALREAALAVAVQDLLAVWKSLPDTNIQTSGVGPGNAASALSKAVFLASLLLTFHHPPRKDALPGQLRRSRDFLHKPIPEALLDWLWNYHDIFPEDFAEVMATEHGPAAHERFWDTVFSLSLRGKIKDVSHLLSEADFGHAVTALEDGADEPGYLGKQLGNVQRVVGRAVSVLDSCPAVQSGDWNVKGSEWGLFRRRVRQALSDLEKFAEGSSLAQAPEEEDDELFGQGFGASGMSNSEFSISKMSQRAQSQVPWSIYESLKQLYAQLLGMRLEIVSASADWVEAVIGLTVWWDGDQDDSSKKSLAASRRSLTRSQRPRSVDLRPGSAYQERLAHSLREVMTEYTDPELHFNATEAVEVGLACIFDGDLEGLLGIVRGWSSVISTALVEIANHGSWLGQQASPSKRIMSDLDQSDLMVLSYGQQEKSGVDPDRALIAYADILSKQSQLHSSRLQRTVQGWELAVQVLNRVEDAAAANRHIAMLLDGLDLTSSESIEKIMKLCDELNLPELGRRMAQGYATYLAENTSNYGGALFYYARAHEASKIKDVLNVLISSCLVHSRAFPASKELDGQLQSIIASPNETLEQLAFIDREAAEILAKHLSGYASLRKFYDLRDEELNLQPGHKASTQPLARKRQAASALVSVIMSAADSIHGGLLDDSVDSVVQVDGLLVLLGEALMFLNQPKRFLDARQIFALMKAAEDLSTVSGTVYQQCQDCLDSAIAAAHGSRVPSPQALLRKSTSSLAASSQFSLINSATTGSQSNASLDGSAVVVKGRGLPAEEEKRAWDWRTGLARGTKGDGVLQILRLGLARELSRTWTEGDFGDASSL